MYRFLLRPKWIAFHVLVAALVVLMVNLAFWQLHRLQDRREFNEEVRSRAALDVASFDDVVGGPAGDAVDPDVLEWRTVTASGTYLPAEQVLVVNRAQGGEVGAFVVDPLVLDDGTVVLVNRGFAPARVTPPPPPPTRVEVTGRLRASQVRHLGQLSDPPTGDLGEVQRVDIDRLRGQLPRSLAPVYIDLLVSDPAEGAFPIPVPDPELDEGSHLSYMVQWFIFSACAVVGWVLAVRRSARRVTG